MNSNLIESKSNPIPIQIKIESKTNWIHVQFELNSNLVKFKCNCIQIQLKRNDMQIGTKGIENLFGYGVDCF